jgi:hypothetical protein
MKSCLASLRRGDVIHYRNIGVGQTAIFTVTFLEYYNSNYIRIVRYDGVEKIYGFSTMIVKRIVKAK